MSLASSPDSKILASLSLDRTLRSWNFETGQPLPNSPITNIDETPTGLAFSPDGTTLAVSGSKGVTLRNPVTGEVLSSLIHSSMQSIAFSPNGKVLAGGDANGAIVLWNMETRRLLGQIFMGHTHPVFSVAISPDGQILASGSGDRTVMLWDLATGQRIGPPLQGHAQAVSGVVFSRDGKTLASSSMDETVILWDLDFES